MSIVFKINIEFMLCFVVKGPPEFEPLGCYEKDDEEREHCDVPCEFGE